MYKLMLVEDESVVRESMLQNIDWSAYGFTICAACADGREALEQLDTVLPDVVITDICMPFVDGLELTRYLREQYPSVLVAILTGYSDFSYAQQAVKLRVHDFLLKPVAPKDVCALLERLAGELLERDSRRSSLRSLQSQAYRAETILRGELFRALLQSQPEPEALARQAASAGLMLDAPVYTAVFCQPFRVVENAAQAQRLLDAAQETASRFPRCAAAMVDQRYAALLVGGRTRDEVTRRARDAGTMLCDAVGRVVNAEAQGGLGSCAGGAAGLHRCFREAFHALGYGFTGQARLTADHLARAAERPVTAADPLPSFQELLRALDYGGSDVQQLLAGLFAELARRKLHRDACLQPLERLQYALEERVPEERRGAAPQIRPQEVWYRLQDVQADFRQLAAFVVRTRKPAADDPARQCVESAKGYILQHYHDSAFSLTELLGLLNVS